jgi:hypothetical protein
MMDGEIRIKIAHVDLYVNLKIWFKCAVVIAEAVILMAEKGLCVNYRT